MRIYFSRHGESEANLLHEHANRGYKYGLTEKGCAQARALAATLEGVAVTRIYSSPLKRAVGTAEIVSRIVGAPVEVSDALREYDCGVLEGRSDRAAWEQHLAVYHRWVDEGRLEERIPGGESYLDMQARFVPLIDRLLAQYGDSEANLLLVAHGGLYRLMLSLVLANVELAYAASHPTDYTQVVVAEARPEGLVCVEWCGEAIEDGRRTIDDGRRRTKDETRNTEHATLDTQPIREDAQMTLFYRPADGVAADFIPFYWEGAYHLFYLKDYRDVEGHGEGTPWFHLVTRDFVHFEEWGEALPRGPAGAQDVWVFTGSVVERDGVFYIFYTGHNSHLKDEGRPVQAIMRATSPDLRTWTKDPAFRFFAPHGYEPDDWRDPFVFWNEKAGEYWMLLAARKPTGPNRHRGCVALAASPDLETWAVRDPFWAPDLYYTHECPDLFRAGGWWVLVYSTFSERTVTHYRLSKGLEGPWRAPADDAFDGRPYYAAKTAGNGQRRYLFGWLATREGETDAGRWQWGGNLVVHELVQPTYPWADGSLAVRPPASVLAPFDHPLPLTPQPVLGEWDANGEQMAARSAGRFSALTLGELPKECLVEVEMTYTEGTAHLGLLLRAGETLDGYYQVRLEPNRQRLVFDRWPRPGDQPFVIERPLSMQAGQPVRLQVLVDGTCAVVYGDERTALSCRMYDRRQGQLGLFVSEGEARFERVRVKVRVH